MLRTLAICAALLLGCTQADARVHRGHRPCETKIFAATHDSVRLENETADAMGARRFENEQEMNDAIARGELVALNEYPSLRLDKRLPLNRRYALPETVAFIQMLSSEFYFEFRKPLTVDSAVRPATVQRKLIRRNCNAAPWEGPRASSHERGTTVDLSKRLSKNQKRWLAARLLYYYALGRVLVIQERACYHVFVREAHNDA